MGADGFYDDQNDNTFDNWYVMRSKILPTEIQKVLNSIDDDEMIDEFVNKYIQQNIKKVYNIAMPAS